ncbi:MAG: hypothetical protein IT337_04835 [Thermomicrobiales bacterium]|nr:hypothetical protein [Thermomicrobiales bacterium]
MFEGSPHQEDAAVAIAAAVEAGEAVRDLYEHAAASTYAKADGSVVTDADFAADAIVRRVLAKRRPADAILTEEGQDDSARLVEHRCWIVDPIDGTQQFVERTGDFDVLVALAVDGEPVVAASVQPSTGLLCVAVAGAGAWTGIAGVEDLERVRYDAVPEPPRIATSIWFGAPNNLGALDAIADRIGGSTVDHTRIGFTPRLFLGNRPCDAILGFRTTGRDQFMAYEWDFAVGDLFIHEAGGCLTDLDGVRFRYNRMPPTFARGLIATVSPALHDRLLTATRAELTERGLL